MINAFDFDGVVSLGIYPGKDDIIITGRCLDESDFVNDILKRRNITNKVFFNEKYTTKERETGTVKSRCISGQHKVDTINKLKKLNMFEIKYFFEDDPIQQSILEQNGINVIKITQNITKY